MFRSTNLYARFGLSHKKTLDGNAKMRINLKNAHKKTCAHLNRIHFLSDNKKCEETTMGTNLLYNFLYAHRKSNVTLCYETG